MATHTDPSAEPRTPLSKERVLRAAISLADEAGIESLTMRKLGQALGVKAMSLYNHVANKEDILDGIVDAVVSEIDVPSAGADWKTAMRQRAISAHEVLLRHPWACSLFMSRINVGPAMFGYADSTLGRLREAGFSIEMADYAWTTIDNYIYGRTLQVLNFPFDREEYAAATTYLPQIPADEYHYLNELANEIAMESGHDGNVEFEFGLDLILDGLERIRDGTCCQLVSVGRRFA